MAKKKQQKFIVFSYDFVDQIPFTDVVLATDSYSALEFIGMTRPDAIPCDAWVASDLMLLCRSADGMTDKAVMQMMEGLTDKAIMKIKKGLKGLE